MTKWMEFARGELGVRDFPGPKFEARVLEYLNTTGLEPNNDETSWCSAFVNWCIGRAGLVGTNNATARSWLNWGREIAQPEPGCVVVLSREQPSSWKGHVGFFDSIQDGRIKLLGGNQGGGVDWDEVCFAMFPKERLLSYRMPA